MRGKSDDKQIHQSIMRELAWDTRVAPTEVGVQVKNGVVTLVGRVDSWAKRMAAERAVHRVAGVLDVANDLDVDLGAAAARSDADVAAQVRHALEWDVHVPDQQIRSTVSHGIVTLDGEVFTRSELEDAERAVERLAGVRSVINKIQINPTVRAEVAEVRAAIANALETHANRDAANLDIKVEEGGMVELSGTVRSWSERVAAIGAARGTRGVRGVLEHLVVRP